MIYIILYISFVKPLRPVDRDTVIVEETTPIRMDIFYQKIKVIRQNSFVLIHSDSKETSGPKLWQQNAEQSYYLCC